MLDKRIGISLLLIFMTGFLPFASLRAQDNYWKNYDLKYRTFRVSLIPGLSTNGVDAPEYAARYSFNIIAGYNGALVKGFELGTLVNANKFYAAGVQIAGLVNYSGKETMGIQLAGLANISGADMMGIQLSGGGNYSGGDMQGIQLAGIGNTSVGDMQGIQLSSVFNWSGAESQGLLAAGVMNYAENSMQGLFWAGAGNFTKGEMQGLIFAGVFNIAEEMQGIIVSGLASYSEDFQGIAVAPFNISRNVEGIQIGHVNIAGDAEGIQIGLVNYAREFNGLPLGLISYYGNGRKNVDFWISGGGFSNIGLKLGTNEIYNMLSVGYNTFLSRNVWQIGWSIGRLREFKNHFLYSDFSYFKINEGGWTSDLNSILKYRLLFGKELFGGFKFYGGPTLNLLISSLPESSDYTLYRLLDYEAGDNQYVFWIGFTLGTELF